MMYGIIQYLRIYMVLVNTEQDEGRRLLGALCSRMRVMCKATCYMFVCHCARLNIPCTLTFHFASLHGSRPVVGRMRAMSV